MMAGEDKKSSPKAEELDSENRKSSDSSNPEKLSSAGGLANESKKLDDLKETEENKKAVAESEGRVEVKEESKKQDAKDKKDSEPAVEKSKVQSPKSKKVEMPELEREYVVPMRKGFMNVPHYRRAKKAVKTLKEFMVRHMNVRDGDLRKVKVDIHLNNEIWFRGIKKPLHKIKVKAKKVGEIVTVTLADAPDVVGFKIAREQKRAAKAAVGSGKSKVEGKGKEAKEKDADKDGVDDKKEEAEDKKAGAEKAAAVAKDKTKDLKHTTKGAHVGKTMPVRKALKK